MAKKPTSDNADLPKKRVRSKKVENETKSIEELPAETNSRKKSSEVLSPIFQSAPTALAPARNKKTENKPAVENAISESEPSQVEGEKLERNKKKNRRNRRERKKNSTSSEVLENTQEENEVENSELDSDDNQSHRRRRRRRAAGETTESTEETLEDGVPTVVKLREPRPKEENNKFESRKRERHRDRDRDRKDRHRNRHDRGFGEMGHRDFIRRRGTVLTDTEFLARRDNVNRKMLVRQIGDRTQIAVLEDQILVEHYVNRNSNISYVGNVYLGKVQNVLPSMEAAFVDIGKGRNAVLYAGEVNWDLAGMADEESRKIENVLKTGDSVLVQVTKDPIGQKGARLTSQISLPGRFLVYVPGGEMSGISRRLPEMERNRLKTILKEHLPEEAGVIIRTAAEGASPEEIEHDVLRLKAQWEDIDKKAKNSSTSAPSLLYSEPDLSVRVIRDIFNEDFQELIIQGNEAWEDINNYLGFIAPELTNKMQKWSSNQDLFTENKIDEQLAKAFDRKVYLPSGGSLVIDKTEAMIVVDVNTGKFIGKGGNLEETVTKNNLEAAEEIARQLRLRDLGGIIVIDFIDMALETNRELVLRRLIECLGRDRTKHQVAEVTSLGLVQMTRKRVGQGLIEAFSTVCEHCNGRGIHIHTEPVKKVHLDKDFDKPRYSQNNDQEDDQEENQEIEEELQATEVEEVEAIESPQEPPVRQKRVRRVVSSGGVVTP